MILKINEFIPGRHYAVHENIRLEKYMWYAASLEQLITLAVVSIFLGNLVLRSYLHVESLEVKNNFSRRKKIQLKILLNF